MAATLTAALLVFSIAVPSLAKTSAEIAKEQEEVKQEIKKLETEQKEMEQERKNMASELEKVKSEGNKVAIEIVSLDADIADAESEIADLQLKIADKEILLTNTQVELEEAQQAREDRYEALKKCIKYMYESGDINYLDIILNATSFTDLLNKIEYVNDILTHDNKIIEEMKELEVQIAENIDTIKIEKNNLELLENEQVKKKHSLEAKVEQKQQTIIKLNADEAVIAQQMTEANERISSNKELLEQMKEEEDRLAKEKAIAAAKEAEAKAAAEKNAAANKYTGGQMLWPLDGYYSISSGYVNRINPIYGNWEVHRGIDIPAPKSTPVRAAADGEVIEANYSYSYGNKVIIYHGGNISTLYAHNSKLLVSVGDKVKKGDTIALVGSTGDSTGNHCHFEVRVNGEHTNPLPYLQGTN